MFQVAKKERRGENISFKLVPYTGCEPHKVKDTGC